MKISIIIPNYNGNELLKKNLPTVLNVKGMEEIIVVDDGSTDESVSYIKDQIHQLAEKFESFNSTQGKNAKLKIIENEKNLGFSSTVNRGVKEAKGEIIVLLNTDVSPEPDFLKPLLSRFSNPQIFAVGCLDKSIESGKTILRGRGVGRWQRGFVIHERGEVDKTDTLWVSGGSGAFRKDLWEKLGGFDPLYNPFYWEDIDLSYRAQKAGYKVFFEPKSIVIHRHEEGVIKSGYHNFKIMTIAYRNQFIFHWKNITDLDKRFTHLVWLPFYLLAALIRGDFAFILGFLEACLRLPVIIKSAFKTPKLFIKSDKEILS